MSKVYLSMLVKRPPDTYFIKASAVVDGALLDDGVHDFRQGGGEVRVRELRKRKTST